MQKRGSQNHSFQGVLELGSIQNGETRTPRRIKGRPHDVAIFVELELAKAID